MQKNGKLLTYGLVFLVWISGFFLLDKVVLMGANHSLSKIDFDPRTVEQRPVFFAIERISTSANIFREMTVSGWAFIENGGENPNKTIALVFASDEESYLVKTSVQPRINLNNIPLLTGHEIPSSPNAFEGTFSPLMMKNGNYRLYVSVEESDSLFGIMDTGRRFTKDSRNFEEYYGGTPLKAPNAVNETNTQIRAHFTCDPGEYYTVVGGWAFLQQEKKKLLPGSLILQLHNQHGTQSFSTVTVNRIDVANYFKDNSLLLSGFSARLPNDILTNGENLFHVTYEGIGQSVFTCKVDWPPENPK